MKIFNGNAFTFIEILISISIIVLFSSLGLVYYNDYAEQKKLDQDTKKLVDTLEMAKTKVSAGDNLLCVKGSEIPLISKYSVNINPTGYQLLPECTPGVPIPIYYEKSKNIGITAYPTSINFPPLPSPVPTACIIIKNDTLQKCNYIQVNSLGNIADGECSACGACPCIP